MADQCANKQDITMDVNSFTRIFFFITGIRCSDHAIGHNSSELQIVRKGSSELQIVIKVVQNC